MNTFDQLSSTCPRCGQALDIPGAVCLSCGTPHPVGDVVLDGAGTLSTVLVSVGYGEHRSWLEQWGRVKNDYADIQEAFSTTGIDNQAIANRLVIFFQACWNLIDHLKNDKSLPSIDHQPREEIKTSEAMKICEAMANTSKHHTRWDPKSATGHIKEINFSGPRITAVIHYKQDGVNGEPHDFDAETVATACMAWWRDFFSKHEIDAP